MKLPYRAWLLIVFGVVLVIGCINPVNPLDLVLEHILTVALVGVLVWTGRRRPFSNLAYTGAFVFLVVHVYGAHYTYQLTPYDAYAERLFGRSISDMFGFTRNHYDRVVHFAFGILFFPMAREIMVRVAHRDDLVTRILAVIFLNIFNTGYELLEWLLTMVVAPEQAEIYNGQQGDIWDAHKDVGLATLGALIALAGSILIASRRSSPPAAT